MSGYNEIKVAFVAPEHNYNIITNAMAFGLDALKEYCNVKEYEDIDKIDKFSSLVMDTFKIYFYEMYKNKMSQVNFYDWNVTLLIKDKAFGIDCEFKLDLTGMKVLSAKGSTLKGHTTMDKFTDWIKSRSDFGMTEFEFALNIVLPNREPELFPDFMFRITPDHWVFKMTYNDFENASVGSNILDLKLYKVCNFVPVDSVLIEAVEYRSDTKELVSIKEGEEGTTIVANSYSPCGKVAKGVSLLHNDLKIDDYTQFVNFLTDEWEGYKAGTNNSSSVDIYVTLKDMMNVVCDEEIHNTGPFAGYNGKTIFYSLLHEAIDSQGAEAVADMMVLGGAHGFDNINVILSAHQVRSEEDFEGLLRKYHSLTLEEKGHISAFINLPDEYIGACIVKKFGSEPLEEYREYYHSFVWA